MLKKLLNRKSAPAEPPKDPLEVLKASGVWRKNEWDRARMTISCHDCNDIPKVKGAGAIKSINGQKVQIMHNGLKVLAGGYHGDWMASIITALKGHHEPQEEKLFYEVIKRLGKKPVIIELGSFWAYYSIWLLAVNKEARAFACEPDPSNMKVGQANAALNKVEGRIEFISAAAGLHDGEEVAFTLDSDPTKNIQTKVKTVDALVKARRIKKVDILHMDVQGVELDALHGAIQSIKAKKIRFVFISTHHYFFSGDPLTHQKCKRFLEEHGAHIIAAHNILESFSGDGLIVASFDPKDRDFEVKVSLNSSDNSLFRPYEEDIAGLMEYVRESQRPSSSKARGGI